MTLGILFGVSVGPGDPQLMTLKAVETIKACSVIAAPRSRGGNMIALNIAQGVIDLSEKYILPLDFTMSHDEERKNASHQRAADQVQAHLDQGRSVAMLNLGDVSIYASFHYVRTILEPMGYSMKMIAGVPSFTAAAAELGVNLTCIDSPLHIIPNGKGSGLQTTATPTRIWMKSGSNLTALLHELQAHNLLDKAILVQNCGMANQRIVHNINITDVINDYLSMVLLLENGAQE